MSLSDNPWTVIESKEVYENPWISVTEFDVINPSGGAGIYGKVHFKNRALGIMAMDNEGQIWLVGQFRFTIDAFSWEIPEGGGPLGTDPLESAKRELKEETGLIADNWEKLLEIHLSNSVSDEFGIIYLATGLRQGVSEPEETEKLHIQKISLEDAYNMVLKHQITDSMSIAAIQQLWIRKLDKKYTYNQDQA
jgi:8-oxo-dGTP pyrophosphatase MutT (NUDIX family)